MLETLKREISQMERKLRFLKYKIVLTVVLPVFIVILAVKVIRTYVNIRVRQIAERQEAIQPDERQTGASCRIDFCPDVGLKREPDQGAFFDLCIFKILSEYVRIPFEVVE